MIFPAELHIVAWPLLAGSLALASRTWRGVAVPPPGSRIGVSRIGVSWAGVLQAGVSRAGVLQGGVLRIGVALLHVCVAAIVVYACLAFVRPHFTEWVETGVVGAAKLWVRGGNVYPDAATVAVYHVYPYGPLLFQSVGAVFAWFGHSDRIVKLWPVVLGAAAYSALFVSLRRQGAGWRESAVAVEVFAIVVGIMGFMVKADIMLVCLACFACLAVSGGRYGVLAGAGLAVAAGLATDIKIHGGLYILPAIVSYFAGRRPVLSRGTLGVAAAGAAIVLVLAVAPFLVPRTSFSHYLFVLRSAAGDGLLAGVFISNLAFLATCVLAVHVLTGPEVRDAAYWRTLYGVIAAGVFVSVFAAKAEAGPHHLIPLLAYLCLALARGLAMPAGMARRALVLGLFLVSFQPVTSVIAVARHMAVNWGNGAVLL